MTKGRVSGLLIQPWSYLIINTIEVGVETLVEPPAGMADLSADVSSVRRAEGLLVVIPTE